MTQDETMLAFRKAIEENPFDESTRKIFADFLDECDMPEEADYQRNWTFAKYEDAREFLLDFAYKANIEPKALMDNLREFLKTGDRFQSDDCMGMDGSNAWFDIQRAKGEDEFWEHYYWLTGLKADKERKSDYPFSCCQGGDE